MPIRWSGISRHSIGSGARETEAVTTILGIDAAWTATQPSGIALVSSEASGARDLCRVIYGHLIDHAAGRIPSLRPSGSVAEAAGVLAAAEQIARAPIDLVAVDMPLSLQTIAERRVSDNLFRSLWRCAIAAPTRRSSIRPGRISDNLRTGFAQCGYNAAYTRSCRARSSGSLSPSGPGGVDGRSKATALQSREDPRLLADRHSSRAADQAF